MIKLCDGNSKCFDIVYRAGKGNISVDNSLEIHALPLHLKSLHFATKMMSSSTQASLECGTLSFQRTFHTLLTEVKQIISTCEVLNECKPQFHKPPKVYFIKATQPFGSINIAFKGPFLTTNKNVTKTY